MIEDFRVNKVILITGASRGFGRAMALRFGKAGCKVAVNYSQNRDAALAAVTAIANGGGEAFPFCADVRSSAEVNSMIDAIDERWGSLDVLINNAAVTKDDLLPRVKIRDWDEMIATNLTGAFNTIRAVSHYMKKNGGGHIINISSGSGLKGKAGQAAYSASKAGLLGLTKSVALELGEFNIQVNAVLPGFMRTDMAQNLSGPAMERIISSNILKREQDISEVAEFVYRLSLMKNISGQVLNLDSRVL